MVNFLKALERPGLFFTAAFGNGTTFFAVAREQQCKSRRDRGATNRDGRAPFPAFAPPSIQKRSEMI